jgi:cell division protein FtsB
VEPGVVPGKATRGPRGSRAPGRRVIARRRFRLLWAVALVATTVYLYYRPISSYLETRRDLAARRAEVASLQRARQELRLRLVNSTSIEATEREARRLGYVKAGEQLFVVKGIPAWRRARALRGEGSP